MKTTISHPNPIATFRIDRFLSQEGFADICNVTRQIIQGVELGISNSIPPSVVNGMKSEYDITATELESLQKQYALWVKTELNSVNVNAITEVIRPTPDSSQVNIPPHIKSFKQWRRVLCESNQYSDTYSGLSKLIKVQPVIFRKYETGRTKSFPEPLADRLRFWGFPESYLSQLAGLPIGKG